jgi:fructokinase
MPQTNMAANSRPVIFGEVLYDCFPKGQDILGGAPFNVAWHLQGLGYAPLMISAVGDDQRGRQILEAMKAWGMDTSGIQIIADRPTGTVEITEAADGHTFHIPSHQAYDAIDARAAAAALASCRKSLLYHGTLALRETISSETLAHIRDSMEMSVFLDVNLRTPWWNLSTLKTITEYACWLKLNDEELQELTSGQADDDEESDSMIYGRGLAALFVTRGDRGAMVVPESGETIEFRGEAATVVDTVGAGDAFSAICIAGILSGWTFPEILERASRFAAVICGIRGATTDSQDIYRQYKEEWRFSYEPGI